MGLRSLLAWCVFVCVAFAAPRASRSIPRGQTDGTPARQFVPQPKKIALVIGIDTYQHKHWSRLDFASRDARRFARMLARGGYARVLKLTTPQQTTLASIRRALYKLKKHNRNPQDTVVIYISAHGTLLGDSDRRRGRRFIIAADTDDENVAETGIEVRWLRAELQGFLSQRKALILATCHSQKRGSKSQMVRGQKGPLAGTSAPRAIGTRPMSPRSSAPTSTPTFCSIASSASSASGAQAAGSLPSRPTSARSRGHTAMSIALARRTSYRAWSLMSEG